MLKNLTIAFAAAVVGAFAQKQFDVIGKASGLVKKYITPSKEEEEPEEESEEVLDETTE